MYGIAQNTDKFTIKQGCQKNGIHKDTLVLRCAKKRTIIIRWVKAPFSVNSKTRLEQINGQNPEPSAGITKP